MTKICKNIARISYRNNDEAMKLQNHFIVNKFFSSYFPIPTEILNILDTEYYAYLIAVIKIWGCSYDTGGTIDDYNFYDENFIEFRFNTIYTPPSKWYEKMVGLGFEIQAYYDQSNVRFFGEFSGNNKGCVNNLYNAEDFPLLNKLEIFPKDVIDYFES